jgi:hypothetical protein
MVRFARCYISQFGGSVTGEGMTIAEPVELIFFPTGGVAKLDLIRKLAELAAQWQKE